MFGIKFEPTQFGLDDKDAQHITTMIQTYQNQQNNSQSNQHNQTNQQNQFQPFQQQFNNQLHY